MNVHPSFADWQFSRGIVPWTIVHDFSEYGYLSWRMRAQVMRNTVALMEPMVQAFKDFGAAVGRVAEVLNAMHHVEGGEPA